MNIFRAVLVSVGLALGLWGIEWGLPNQENLPRILPANLLNNSSFHQRLADSYKIRHERLGANLMISKEAWGVGFSGQMRVTGGWSDPPEVLLAPYRSFHIRSSHEDEQTTILALSRMKPRRLDFNPHIFVYGAAYIYSVGVFIALGVAAGLISLHSSILPYLADPSKMAAMYLAGRLLSVCSYIACGLILLRIGRRHLNAEAGWTAGLLFLLTPAIVVSAHVLKIHMLWCLTGLLTLDKSIDVLLHGRTRDYVWSGIFAGLTVGIFLMGWSACLIVASAGVLRLWSHRAWRSEFKGLIASGAAAAGAFFMTNPYWILDYKMLRAESELFSATITFKLLNPFLFLWSSLRHAATTPLLALILCGAILAWRRRKSNGPLFLVLCAFLCGLVPMIFNNLPVVGAQQTRYFIAWLAVGHLLAAQALLVFWKYNGAGRVLLRTVLGLAVLHLGLSGFTFSRNFHTASTTRSTHIRSGEWIESHIPAKSTLGLFLLPQPSNCPYFQFNRYDLVFIESSKFADLSPSDLPQYFIVPELYRSNFQPQAERYQLIETFDREELFPWISIDPNSTTANPVIEIYKLKEFR